MSYLDDEELEATRKLHGLNKKEREKIRKWRINNMEEKIGFAVITTQEYKELIEDNINKAKCIEELNEVAFKRNSINEKLEKYFFERLLDNESYHLKNMKECKLTDYDYQQLYTCFLKIGIDDIQYIDLSIARLKDNFDNKENKEEDK